MKYFFASLCILLIVSCSVQKRHYQKGFYISRDASVPTKSPAAKKQVNASLPDPAYLSADAKTGQQDLSLASNKVLISMPQEDSCDVIIFRDGTELLTRIIEVSSSEVRYKRCDNLSGPVYVSRKSDLFQLRYSNGTKELMKEEVPKPSPQPRYNQPQRNQNENPPQQPNPAANYALYSGVIAMLSLIFGFALPILFVSSILSAINALRSANKFFKMDRQEPGLYAGRGKSLAGLTLGIITLFFFLLFILVVILLI